MDWNAQLEEETVQLSYVSGVLVSGDIRYSDKDCTIWVLGADTAQQSYVLFVILEADWLAANAALMDEMMDSLRIEGAA